LGKDFLCESIEILFDKIINQIENITEIAYIFGKIKMTLEVLTSDTKNYIRIITFLSQKINKKLQNNLEESNIVAVTLSLQELLSLVGSADADSSLDTLIAIIKTIAEKEKKSIEQLDKTMKNPQKIREILIEDAGFYINYIMPISLILKLNINSIENLYEELIKIMKIEI
jgi:hypothetical protein